VNLEPYAPAVSLVVLSALALASFLRARGLLKRFGATTGTAEEATRSPRRSAPAPWWESHLQDYVAEAPPVTEAGPPQAASAVTADRPEPTAEPPLEARPAAGVAKSLEAKPGETALAGASAPTAEYVMEAPVELWFGQTRVGVRAGSDTERRFQRFAEVLFEELAAARSR